MFSSFLHYVQRQQPSCQNIHVDTECTKGDIKDDLRLQYRGQEPRFSCQFQSSSTGQGLPQASLRDTPPDSRASLFNQCAATFTQNSFNSEFYSVSGAYPTFKGGREYKKSCVFAFFMYNISYEPKYYRLVNKNKTLCLLSSAPLATISKKKQNYVTTIQWAYYILTL